MYFINVIMFSNHLCIMLIVHGGSACGYNDLSCTTPVSFYDDYILPLEQLNVDGFQILLVSVFSKTKEC